MTPIDFPDEWGVKSKPKETNKFDRKHLYMVFTRNYLNTIPDEEKAIIQTISVREIGQKVNQHGEHIPDFIIFDPKAKTKKVEDQGRSLHIPMKTIPTKVYVKLDDYGSPMELSKQVGRIVNTQFALTFMLAEDY